MFMSLSTYRVVFKASMILVVGLAFIFPSKTMAGVTHGTASCPAGTAKELPNGGWGCTIPLHVGRPGPGGGVNPNDWGMCGVLGLAATFGPETVAEVIVEPNGYYAVSLAANVPKYIPTLNWTCVLFTDFQGVPPVSDATASGSPPDGFSFNGGGYPGASKPIPGSTGNACIWAGLSGNLTTYVPVNQGEFGFAFAEFETPATNIGSENVTSYAFCSGYSAVGWTGWNYVIPHATFYAPPHITKLGFNDANDWCYMGGIEANLTSPDAPVPPVSAHLYLSSGGDYSIGTSPAGYIGISFNCLPLKQ
jgi:hypothetical protein